MDAFFILLVLLTITQVVARCFPQNPHILSIRKICSSLFLRRAVALVFVALHVALHRVSIRTLDDLSFAAGSVSVGVREGSRCCHFSFGLLDQNALALMGTRSRRKK